MFTKIVWILIFYTRSTENNWAKFEEHIIFWRHLLRIRKITCYCLWGIPSIFRTIKDSWKYSKDEGDGMKKRRTSNVEGENTLRAQRSMNSWPMTQARRHFRRVALFDSLSSERNTYIIAYIMQTGPWDARLVLLFLLTTKWKLFLINELIKRFDFIYLMKFMYVISKSHRTRETIPFCYV